MQICSIGGDSAELSSQMSITATMEHTNWEPTTELKLRLPGCQWLTDVHTATSVLLPCQPSKVQMPSLQCQPPWPFPLILPLSSGSLSGSQFGSLATYSPAFTWHRGCCSSHYSFCNSILWLFKLFIIPLDCSFSSPYAIPPFSPCYTKLYQIPKLAEMKSKEEREAFIYSHSRIKVEKNRRIVLKSRENKDLQHFLT